MTVLCSKCNHTFLNQTDWEFDHRPFPHMKEVSLSGYWHASIVHYTTRYSVLIASLSLLCLFLSSCICFQLCLAPSSAPCPAVGRPAWLLVPPSQRNTVSRPLITRRLFSVGCGFGELGMTSYIWDATKPESHTCKLDYREMEMKRRLKCGSTVAFPRRELLIMRVKPGGILFVHLELTCDVPPVAQIIN